MTKLARLRPKGHNRAPKLTPEVAQKICYYLELGNYMEAAAALCGVHKDTVYQWLRVGNMEGANKKYRQFVLDVERSIAAYENRAISRIEMAGRGAPAEYDAKGNLIRAEVPANWKADAWRLERRLRGRWAQSSKVEVTSPNPQGEADEAALDRDIATFALALGWTPPK